MGLSSCLMVIIGPAFSPFLCGAMKVGSGDGSTEAGIRDGPGKNFASVVKSHVSLTRSGAIDRRYLGNLPFRSAVNAVFSARTAEANAVEKIAAVASMRSLFIG